MTGGLHRFVATPDEAMGSELPGLPPDTQFLRRPSFGSFGALAGRSGPQTRL